MTSEILKDIENLATIIRRGTRLAAEAAALVDHLAGPAMGAYTRDAARDAAEAAVARSREALLAATSLVEAVAQLDEQEAA